MPSEPEPQPTAHSRSPAFSRPPLPSPPSPPFSATFSEASALVYYIPRPLPIHALFDTEVRILIRNAIFVTHAAGRRDASILRPQCMPVFARRKWVNTSELLLCNFQNNVIKTYCPTRTHSNKKLCLRFGFQGRVQHSARVPRPPLRNLQRFRGVLLQKVYNIPSSFL